MEIKQFKIRCSAIGQIMTNPRSKSELLSQTTKTYCETWLKEQIYGTEKRVQSKYLTKGIDVEQIAMEYYSDVKGMGFVLPNYEHFENDFMTGTADLIYKDTVIDFKSSWDCFTFPLFEDQVDKGYFAQLQGYMALTGLKKGRLVYTLQNTPNELEWDEPIDYTDLDSKYRIKEYHFDYDPAFIVSVEQRVLECRQYINQLIERL
jgi:hypothetical protein